jgi:hypothetical protein
MIRRCRACKTLSRHSNDTTIGGYKYCPVCHPMGTHRNGPRDRVQLERVPLSDDSFDAALAVVRAADLLERGLGSEVELATAVKLWRESQK